jgi:hypothetical protein
MVVLILVPGKAEAAVEEPKYPPAEAQAVWTLKMAPQNALSMRSYLYLSGLVDQ